MAERRIGAFANGSLTGFAGSEYPTGDTLGGVGVQNRCPAVNVERYGDRRMPQTFLDDHRVDAGYRRQRRPGVALSVERDAAPLV